MITVKIERIILVFAILMLTPWGAAYSQKAKDTLHSYVLCQNQVTYKTPENCDFTGLGPDRYEVLKCIFKTSYLYRKCRNKVISKDKNFVTQIYIPPVYSKDSVNIYLELTPDVKIEINTYHLSHIKADYKLNTGEFVTSIKDLSLEYKSPEYARQAFNADTVITYPLKMWKKYKKKYNHCQVMIIQKNTRGPISLYCFYNDKGEKKLDTYLKSLEGMFWYREPKDFIEVPELPKTDSIIYLKPRKRKRWRKHQDITGDISKPTPKNTHHMRTYTTTSRTYKPVS